MKSKILTIISLSISVLAIAQDRWHSSMQFDIVSPNKKIYDYGLPYQNGYSGYSTDLTESGWLIDSYGIQGDYSYQISKHISFGVVSGFEAHTRPHIEMVKLGGILKLFFVDNKNVFVYLQDAHNFSLNKDKFLSGNNFRLGLTFPVWKTEKFNLNLGFASEQNFLRMNGSKPLLGWAEEKPNTIIFKSILMSIGVQF